MLSIVLYSLGLAYSNIDKKEQAIETLERSISLMESLETSLDIYPEAIKQLENLKMI